MLDDLKKIHQGDAGDALGVAEKRWRQYGEAEFLQAEVQAWLPTVPTKHNIAKQIAQECIGRSVIIYASPVFEHAARHWKKAFNEHARQLAWVGELSPSELLSWTKQPQTKPYAVLELLGDYDSPEVQNIITESARTLSGLRPEPIRVYATGQTAEQQSAWLLNLGDFVSVYTALLSGVNPTPGTALEKFKSIKEE